MVRRDDRLQEMRKRRTPSATPTETATLDDAGPLKLIEGKQWTLNVPELVPIAPAVLERIIRPTLALPTLCLDRQFGLDYWAGRALHVKGLGGVVPSEEWLELIFLRGRGETHNVYVECNDPLLWIKEYLDGRLATWITPFELDSWGHITPSPDFPYASRYEEGHYGVVLTPRKWNKSYKLTCYNPSREEMNVLTGYWAASWYADEWPKKEPSVFRRSVP